MLRVVAYRLLHDEELAAVRFVGETHRPHALEMPLRILLTNTAHSILCKRYLFRVTPLVDDDLNLNVAYRERRSLADGPTKRPWEPETLS